jgi:hypothetical protein
MSVGQNRSVPGQTQWPRRVERNGAAQLGYSLSAEQLQIAICPFLRKWPISKKKSSMKTWKALIEAEVCRGG